MRPRVRSGFTLVELIVVIGIMLLLTGIVVSVYNANAGGDRMRSSARTAQSAFLGARDRALHAKDRRGIRLLRDPADLSVVNGFAYLQPIPRLEYAPNSIQLERRDDDGNSIPDSADVVIVNGFANPAVVADWYRMREFFSDPPRIRIPAGTGQWYTFYWSTTGPYALTASQPYLQLTTSFVDPGAPGVLVAHAYTTLNSSAEIELSPELLPNHQPISMPSGVVVDLYWSGLPGGWYQQMSVVSGSAIPAGWISEGIDPTNAANMIIREYSPHMDMMFSPRGTLTGPIAALGPIHFLLNDVEDATQNLNPIDIANKGEKLVLTVFPQTGHVQTYPIDPTDSDSDGFADDLFRTAKSGSRSSN